VIDKKANFSFNEQQRSALLKKQLPYLDAWRWQLELVPRSGIDDKIVKKAAALGALFTTIIEKSPA
jgi:hypothetical protein